VFVGAYTYETCGRFLSTACRLKLVHCYLGVYVFEAVLLKSIFTGLKHVMGDKLLTANAFGKGEYIYGTFAGAARFACIVVMCLALLHVSYVPEAASTAGVKSLKDDTSILDSWTVNGVQQAAFSRSFIGPVIKRHLSDLLLKSGEEAPRPKPSKLKSIRDERRKSLDDAMNPK